MHTPRVTPRRLARHSLMAVLLSSATIVAAQDAQIVQPGAPGQATRQINVDQAVALADTSYSPADVSFMQNMIAHHRQAVEMAALVKDRTNREEIVAVSGRIDASQADEMKFMTTWLGERSQPASTPAIDHASMGHGNHGMSGMASSEDMARLAAASGGDFDRLFLELMIRHHEGALEMVRDLLKQPGSAYDPVMFEFTNDVNTDQKAEIERMNALLASLSDDPRAGLAAGFRDAGEAISGMRKLAALPKPAGFFDPKNPAELALPKPKKDAGETGAKSEETPAEASTKAPVIDTAAKSPVREKEETKTQFSERSPLLDFANTDMAFSGDTLVVGNYHGFNIYKLGVDGVPTLLSSVVCPGGQGDVSVVGDLLIMSVEQTRGRVDCGLQGVAGDVSAERFRGLRIFDISDLARPLQVGQVQTCRGSHTHSVVSQDAKSIVVYNSGTGRVRDEKELAGCIGEVPGDDRTALFRIDVIEIPVANPAAARIVESPTVFADPETGRLAGLWQGGDHGDDTQDTNRTDQCHDITVFPTLKIAAGACSGNGIVFDISNPLKPKRIDEVVDKGFAYWHSATFNNDGTKVVFTDEWGGGGRPRCRASDPRNWGANAIYDIKDGELTFRSLYKLPAPQTDKENCVAHNGSIIPVPGRDIFLQAWYQGGISVMEFTDSANPREIAYFDRGPISDEQMAMGGYWSAYYYRGRIYATEIARGLDVFALEPSEFLNAEEIAAAEGADQGGTFNPQTQYPVTWPGMVAAR
ncbi:DUF305 domain-containing protein [Allopontixanthobacter sp.]|uniref:DUF305 domain-containing protein n=1 Tax=Allopontixanthobacter sp. TaxID=2906452 RepID=UPI002AB8DAA2|nr:DUF305 domain-containing protein [Allopontixanthobacter sp.]MDZ4308664.1 DUF305 domain-containing protein [Allopontixanthobacter sp.]